MPSLPAAVPTVVLALPESLVSTALATALQARCDVVAVAQSWDDFEDALAKHRPAVVVLDIAVGTASALTHLRQLTAAHHDTRFVLCTRHLDPVVVERALLAGASAVVDYTVAAANLADALCSLCYDGIWPDGIGIGAAGASSSRAPLRPLSPRHLHVYELLWLGKPQAEIAEALGIGVSTVQRHMTEIRKSYGVENGVPGPWERVREVKRGRKREG